MLIEASGKNEHGDNIGVQCCSLDGTNSSRPGCKQSLDWPSAKAYCEMNEMRLCTAAEVRSGIGAGTGCNFDAYLVWTSDECNGFPPLNLEYEYTIRTVKTFYEEKELSNIHCETPIIHTDIRFVMARDNSDSSSTIRYWRFDTNQIEMFEFFGGPTDRTTVSYDGRTLTCDGREGQTQCKHLPFQTAVPAIVLSVDFNPRNGTLDLKDGKWYRNQYTLKGTYYSAVCPE